MRNLLLTIHILAAAVWVGGGLHAALSFPRHAANSGLTKALAVDEALGGRFFGAAMALLVLSGVWLVTISDTFGWGSGFVLIGIGVIVAEGVLQGAWLGPATKRLVAAGDSETSVPSFFKWGAATSFALVAFAVWAMVAKVGA